MWRGCCIWQRTGWRRVMRVLKSTHTEIPSGTAYLLVGVARRPEPNANVEAADVLISITLWSWKCLLHAANVTLFCVCVCMWEREGNKAGGEFMAEFSVGVVETHVLWPYLTTNHIFTNVILPIYYWILDCRADRPQWWLQMSCFIQPKVNCPKIFSLLWCTFEKLEPEVSFLHNFCLKNDMND